MKRGQRSILWRSIRGKSWAVCCFTHQRQARMGRRLPRVQLYQRCGCWQCDFQRNSEKVELALEKFPEQVQNGPGMLVGSARSGGLFSGSSNSYVIASLSRFFPDIHRACQISPRPTVKTAFQQELLPRHPQG